MRNLTSWTGDRGKYYPGTLGSVGVGGGAEDKDKNVKVQSNDNPIRKLYTKINHWGQQIFLDYVLAYMIYMP